MVVTFESSEAQVIRKMNQRIIKNFLDVIIMSELRHSNYSGYDIISFIHNKYQILVSSGTIYSLLYSLERSNLIKGVWTERKRTYKLTEEGQRRIGTLLNANPDLRSFMNNFLKVQ